MLNSVGLIIILVLAGMTGLVIYSTYKNCDPIKNGQINKGDQVKITIKITKLEFQNNTFLKIS